jgi:hypothetical protein
LSCLLALPAMTALAAWLDLLPYLEPFDLRMLLDEAAWWRSAERRARQIPTVF